METKVELKEFNFDDLKFSSRIADRTTALQARLDFPNGYGVSVLTPDETGRNRYCQANKGFYELALFKNGNYTYGSILNDDKMEESGEEYDGVWIDCSKEEINRLMKKIQELKSILN